jgi:prepilin signal peptidase PulO-like enzyme (type II secretory pathway)
VHELLQAPWEAQVALIAMFAALGVSVYTDLRQRLVYDVVWIAGLAVILGMFGWLGSWPLLLACLSGMVICAGPMLLANLIRFRGRRAMARGDFNLMLLPGAVSGAAAGWTFSLMVLLYVSIAGGVQAILWLAVAKLRGHPRPEYIPYCAAIAAGTLGAFLFGGGFL